MKRWAALFSLAFISCAFAQSVVTPPDFRMPGGSGCAGEIARYRAVMENDDASGNVAQSVYARSDARSRRPRASARRARTQGDAMIHASQIRHGYSTDRAGVWSRAGSFRKPRNRARPPSVGSARSALVREAAQERADGDAAFEPRQSQSPAHRWAPEAKARCRFGLRAGISRSGSGNWRGSRLAAPMPSVTSRPAAIDAADLCLARGAAVAELVGAFEAQEFLDRRPDRAPAPR